MIKPPRLRPGDTVGLVAPASGVLRTERIEASVRYLEHCGYRVHPGRHLLASHGAFGGTDAQRAMDFNEAIRNPEVKAIFAIRGGYGSPRLLRLVDYDALRRTPKILVGFSDLTALQLAVYRNCELVTFSGPLPGPDFSEKEVDPFAEEQFWRLITSTADPGCLATPSNDPLVGLSLGAVSGPLLGGCLTMVTQVLGTAYCPWFQGAILVLEDTNEEPYRVDRMLTHLGNAGVLDAAAGFVFGKWHRCVPKDPQTPHFPVDRLVLDMVDSLGKPAIANLSYGHIPRRLTLPIGLPVTMDAGRGEIRLLESAVA